MSTTETNGTGNDPARCDACPIFVWQDHRNTAEFEKQIRADAALRFQRTFDMWAKQLERANEEIARLNLELRRLRAKAS